MMNSIKTGIFLAAFCLLGSVQAQPIIGGVNAAQGEFPFIAGLTLKSEQNLFDGTFCGASLISPEWVLTAAHCMYDDADQLMSASSIDVFLNVWKLSAPGASHERISVSQVVVHPNYNSTTLDNDIALIKLSRSTSQPSVKVIGSSQSGFYQASTPVTIAGWGIYDEANELYADVLRKADIEVIAESTCNAATAYNGEMTSNMFCAGKMDGSKDACSGDSGGPMVYYDGSNATQIGIVSWGEGCALAGFPGIYTRLINYLNWINTVTGMASTHDLQKMNLGYQRLTFSEQMEIKVKGDQTLYKLFDSSGRLVKSGNFKESLILNYSDFATGLYFLECSNSFGSVREKLILSH